MKGIINHRTNRIAVIDPNGNLAEIPRNAKDPTSDPELKDGWRFASLADIAKAKDVEAKRAAEEAKVAPKSTGGPF